MRNPVLIGLLFLVLTFVACNGNQKQIKESDFGEEWPFTVKSGTVECTSDTYAVIFKSGGVSYALNDAARKSEMYVDINSILKSDTNYYGKEVRMDMSPIEFEGLKLCNRGN
jgi:hypothetical protein